MTRAQHNGPQRVQQARAHAWAPLAPSPYTHHTHMCTCPTRALSFW